MPSSEAVPGLGGVGETISMTRCLGGNGEAPKSQFASLATVQFFEFEKVLNGIVSPDPEELRHDPFVLSPAKVHDEVERFRDARTNGLVWKFDVCKKHTGRKS